MNDSTYESHREQQLRAARDSFAEFSARIGKKGSARQRALLAGIEAPEDDCEMANGRQRDAAEMPLASYRVDVADAVDSFADTLRETFKLSAVEGRLLASWMENEIARRALTYRASDINNICGVFIDTKNPRLFAAGLAFAADLASLNGLGTQAEFGKRIGLSRAAVNKVKIFWEKLLSLPANNAHSKSPAARAKYRELGRTDHWRNRKADGSQKANDNLTKLSKRYAKK